MQFANDATRSALKERLLSGDYSDLTAAGEVNPQLKAAIVALIGARDTGSADEGAAENEQPSVISKRRAGLELIVTIATRLRNQNIYNFLAVVLSVLALGSRVPLQFWGILTMMGVLFSDRWTRDLVKEIGDEVAASRHPHASVNIGFGVTDNKAYLTKVTYINAHVEGLIDAPPRATGQFLYTVNNLQVPVIMPHGIDLEMERGALSSP